MKERPILFSAPMVRAILNGSKTQTRRVVKPQPSGYVENVYRPFPHEPNNWQGFGGDYIHWYGKCPYGQPGDHLWVRENFQPLFAEGWEEGMNPDGSGDSVNWKTGEGYDPSYPATDGIVEFYDHTKDELTQRVWPSIHMPRWASRIQLKITNIRVERLQECSEADAQAEGAQFVDFGKDRYGQQNPGWRCDRAPSSADDALLTARFAYGNLWESINGPGSWDANPWVWVIEFKRVKP